MGNQNNENGAISKYSSNERKELLKEFYDKVVFPQRRKLLFYRQVTNQTAQVDSDGYIAQLVSSIVTGIPGTSRKGKTVKGAGDLSDGTEVKSSYRIEQKGAKEDGHINFGSMTKEKMLEFLSHKRCIVVHTSYDVLGRMKTEVLDIDLMSKKVQGLFEAFYLRSKMKKPQFQPRLYPDGKRDIIYAGPQSFKSLDARVLARVVETAEGALVDIWSPEEGSELKELLKISDPKSIQKMKMIVAKSLNEMNESKRKEFALKFFIDCFVAYRKSYLNFCKITNTTQNLGIANLSQHMVSIVTGLKGMDSNARGSDLENGSEIKQAMGSPNDSLGSEDWPRLNLGKNIKRLLGWTDLYAVRIECKNNHFMMKVLKADLENFRKQVNNYFGDRSLYSKSENMQFHVSRDFNIDVFTGKDSKGIKRELKFHRLIALREKSDGGAELI